MPHISKGGLQPRSTIGLKAARELPRVLTVVEVRTILDACDRLRDRFLFALLYESGIRIAEAPTTWCDGCAGKTGIALDPHWYRHTAATRLLMASRSRWSPESSATPTSPPHL